MTESPERIWINDKWEAYLRPTFNGDKTGYIRADLVDPAAKALAEHTAQAIREAALREAALRIVCHEMGTPMHSPPQLLTDAHAAILALIDKKEGAPTEYERKVAQMKKDFPNGI